MSKNIDNSSVLIKNLIENNEVIIVYPYSHSEVSNPKLGGTRLIFEQIEFLKANRYKVHLISLENIVSITSFLYKLKERFRRDARILGYWLKSSSEKRRWWLNLFQVILNEFLSRIDFLFRIKLKYQLSNITSSVTLIYHYPYGVGSFISALKNRLVKIIIYEHNVEWKFFEDKIGHNIIAKFFIWLAKHIELNNLREVDYILCVSERFSKR